MINIKIIDFGTPEYDAEVALRDRVLRKPLGLQYTSEQLAAEKDEVHINAFDDSGVIGCLLLKRISEKELKMRQVAVDQQKHSLGIGRKLVEYCEEYARRNNYELITLHAREAVIQFYLKLGYLISGDRFTEVTIPHFPMRKVLNSAHEV